MSVSYVGHCPLFQVYSIYVTFPIFPTSGDIFLRSVAMVGIEPGNFEYRNAY